MWRYVWGETVAKMRSRLPLRDFKNFKSMFYDSVPELNNYEKRFSPGQGYPLK